MPTSNVSPFKASYVYQRNALFYFRFIIPLIIGKLVEGAPYPLSGCLLPGPCRILVMSAGKVAIAGMRSRLLL